MCKKNIIKHTITISEDGKYRTVKTETNGVIEVHRFKLVEDDGCRKVWRVL